CDRGEEWRRCAESRGGVLRGARDAGRWKLASDCDRRDMAMDFGSARWQGTFQKRAGRLESRGCGEGSFGMVSASRSATCIIDGQRRNRVFINGACVIGEKRFAD